jgi:hypothetical protein
MLNKKIQHNFSRVQLERKKWKNNLYLVFISMLNFLGFNPKSTQAFHKLATPCPIFLDKIMNFWTSTWIDFIDAYLKPQVILLLKVIYINKLNNACSK